MSAEDLPRRLEQLFEPVLRELGIELVELALAGNPRKMMLRVYVDRPAGVSIGQCAALSRSLADVLDTHDPIDGAYTLEVSSPGLTRPLKTRRDFERSIGKRIKLVLTDGTVRIGDLASASSQDLVLTEQDRKYTIALDDVSRANLQFEF